MMDVLRLTYDADYRARLLAMFPQITAAQLMRFDDLVASNRVMAKDGEPHRALEQWVAAVIGSNELEAKH